MRETLTSNYPLLMARLGTAGVFLFVSFFVLLPLYELADVGEHWPNDGTYVAMILTVLFLAGLTLILRKLASIASRTVIASQACQPVHLVNDARIVAASTGNESDADAASARIRAHTLRLKYPDTWAPILDGAECSRLLILRDFRI